MEWLAEWMGWNRAPNTKYEFHWDMWMAEVEPRIRERGLWPIYINTLLEDMDVIYSYSSRECKAMTATLAQRAESLKRVLEE